MQEMFRSPVTEDRRYGEPAMRHARGDLLGLVYRFYPRGMRLGDPRYRETDEHRRLVEARRHAGTGAAYEGWRAMLGRLRVRFPGCEVENRSFHLATGGYDGCYSGKLLLPALEPGRYRLEARAIDPDHART